MVLDPPAPHEKFRFQSAPPVRLLFHGLAFVCFDVQKREILLTGILSAVFYPFPTNISILQ